ncbi:hypothetical protein BgiMline_029161 [Biomphalaria glabrata]
MERDNTEMERDNTEMESDITESERDKMELTRNKSLVPKTKQRKATFFYPNIRQRIKEASNFYRTNFDHNQILHETFSAKGYHPTYVKRSNRICPILLHDSDVISGKIFAIFSA